jgi:hypothetical protein
LDERDYGYFCPRHWARERRLTELGEPAGADCLLLGPLAHERSFLDVLHEQLARLRAEFFASQELCA